ncbi:HAD family hydrolase [Luteimonas sp. TWI1416]|uniref:HAD family hydrolase n=1 Tax=unclassified Luteimonas TaxID=2629088 RepID=UPI00320B2765
MNLALFDFDGTITTKETFADFIHFAVPPVRLGMGKVLLAPLVIGYRTGRVSGNLMRGSAVRIGLAGMPVDRAQALGRRFADEVLLGLQRPNVMSRIEWHKARGDRVVVVSGALELYLAPWCERHGLELICSRLEVREGRLTGSYAGNQCVADEKARRVRETIDTSLYEEIYAYGDTSDDFAMLRLAKHADFRGRVWMDPEVRIDADILTRSE